MIADLARFEEVASQTLGPKERTYVLFIFLSHTALSPSLPLSLPSSRSSFVLRGLGALADDLLVSSSRYIRFANAHGVRKVHLYLLQCFSAPSSFKFDETSTDLTSSSLSSSSDSSKRPRPATKCQNPRRRPFRSRLPARTNILEPVFRWPGRTARYSQDRKASVRVRGGSSRRLPFFPFLLTSSMSLPVQLTHFRLVAPSLDLAVQSSFGSSARNRPGSCSWSGRRREESLQLGDD